MEIIERFANFEASVLDAVPAAVIVSDLEGTLLYANQFSEHLYGRPVRHLVGTSAAELAGVELDPETGVEILRTLLAGRTWQGDFEVHRPDGSSIVANAADSGLFDQDGRLVAVVSIVTDVSDERRSFDRLSRLYSERDRVAQSLQAALLPPSLPEVDGLELAARYRAAGEANDVGGDFYDVFPVGGDAWAAVIGDVSGRGAEAAAVTGLVRYAVRASSHQAVEPAAMLTVANAVLRESQGSLAERFCSAACVLARPASPATWRVASAGHPAPLVIRTDGSVVELSVQGTALGLLPELVLETAETVIGPGDTVILYTDGLSEARDRSGRFFGEVALRQVIAQCRDQPAEAVATVLLAAVEDFSEGRIADDLALLVLRSSVGSG